MLVKNIWFIELPFNLQIHNDFYNTGLSNYKFDFDDIKIELIISKSKKSTNEIKITIIGEYSDDYLPAHEHMDCLIEFNHDMTIETGVLVQKFFDGVSRYTVNDDITIFDGRDFCVKYQFEMEPPLLNASYSLDDRDTFNLNDSNILEVKDYVNRKPNTIDNVWNLLKEAENAYEYGKYAIAILNMAMMLELLITSKLQKFLNTNGRFKKELGEKLISEFGKRPSFACKYYVFGLKLITDQVLDDDLIESVSNVYRLRDKIAHGYSLFEIKLIEELEIDELNCKDYICFEVNQMYKIIKFIELLSEVD